MHKILLQKAGTSALYGGQAKQQRRLRFKMQKNILMEMVRRQGNWLLRKVVVVWTLLPSWHKWKQNWFCAHCHSKKNCTSVPRGWEKWEGTCVYVLKWESGQGPEGTRRLYHLCPTQGFSSLSCCSPPRVPQGWKGPRGGKVQTLMPEVLACPGVAQPSRAGFALGFVKGHLKGLVLSQVGQVPGKATLSGAHRPAAIASAVFPQRMPPPVVGFLCF